mmetsp:Transcript_12307/g.20268  ORF Transcript_12307/g.20268 Transcript_12307/m.20268 type:complete len:104 (-) Transcript_12307:917-1228(-)
MTSFLYAISSLMGHSSSMMAIAIGFIRLCTQTQAFEFVLATSIQTSQWKSSFLFYMGRYQLQVFNLIKSTYHGGTVLAPLALRMLRMITYLRFMMFTRYVFGD